MAPKTKDIALDKLLVSRFREGDHTAFDELVGRHWDRIYSRVVYLLKNKQDAEINDAKLLLEKIEKRKL